MTARTEHPLEPRELARAGRVWAAASRWQREGLVCMAFMYPQPLVAGFGWAEIGEATRRDIARAIEKFCELVRATAAEPKGEGHAET